LRVSSSLVTFNYFNGLGFPRLGRAFFLQDLGGPGYIRGNSYENEGKHVVSHNKCKLKVKIQFRKISGIGPQFDSDSNAKMQMRMQIK